MCIADSGEIAITCSFHFQLGWCDLHCCLIVCHALAASFSRLSHLLSIITGVFASGCSSRNVYVTLLVLLILFSSDPVVWLQSPYWNLEPKVFIIKRANSLGVWSYLYFQQPSLSSSFQSSPSKPIFFSGPGPLTVFQTIHSFSHSWVCLNECLAPSSASTKSQSYVRPSTSVSCS